MPQSEMLTVSASYELLVKADEVQPDPAQKTIIKSLDQVLDYIRNRRVASKSNALGWLFAKRQKKDTPTKGLYIHGSVGRGKTMLMDMFYELVPAKRKKRIHFNDFMADVHNRIHLHRQKFQAGESREKDPIPPVASQLFAEAWILCFDEFSVTDITDAMILSRLFEQLFSKGCILIATSNVEPVNLYKDGLSRELFLPFIDLLDEHVDVLSLDSPTDYRMEKTNQLPIYLSPLNDATQAKMDEAWSLVTAGKTITSTHEIENKGRK
ncbi:MAG: cell division protein ZapE, partial [Lentilitoribacter sp.]